MEAEITGCTVGIPYSILKLFLDHNKAFDEEIDVIDLVDPVLISEKSHTGQKGRWAHPTSKTPDPTC